MRIVQTAFIIFGFAGLIFCLRGGAAADNDPRFAMERTGYSPEAYPNVNPYGWDEKKWPPLCSSLKQPAWKIDVRRFIGSCKD